MRRSLTLTSRASADWIQRGEVRIPPGLVLSFQRFAMPEAGTFDRAPASLGLLPAGLNAAHELIIPLAEDECFWIGLGSTSAAWPVSLAVAVELGSGDVCDAISGMKWDTVSPATVTVPDALQIPGIRRPDGRLDPFVRAARKSAGPLCVRVRFRVTSLVRPGDDTPRRAHETATREMPLRLVDYETFAAESGVVPPAALDPDAGYKGWLLP